MKKAILFTIVAAVCFVGCKKEDKKTIKDYLTAHKWIPGSVSLNGTPESFDACDVDNTLLFSKDGYLTEDVGKMKCDIDDENSTFNYTLSADEKTITISALGQTMQWTLVTCTNERLIIKYLDGTDLYEATYLPE